MTEIDALEKTALIWDWLAQNPGRKKSEAYKALRLPSDLNDCPLCEAVMTKTLPALEWPHIDCDLCPLREFWPGRCEAPGSAYWLWIFGTPAQRNVAAQAIADAARIQLSKIVLRSVDEEWMKLPQEDK